jgi:hypothetical protein
MTFSTEALFGLTTPEDASPAAQCISTASYYEDDSWLDSIRSGVVISASGVVFRPATVYIEDGPGIAHNPAEAE